MTKNCGSVLGKALFIGIIGVGVIALIKKWKENQIPVAIFSNYSSYEAGITDKSDCGCQASIN